MFRQCSQLPALFLLAGVWLATVTPARVSLFLGPPCCFFQQSYIYVALMYPDVNHISVYTTFSPAKECAYIYYNINPFNSQIPSLINIRSIFIQLMAMFWILAKGGICSIAGIPHFRDTPSDLRCRWRYCQSKFEKPTPIQAGRSQR